VVGDTAQAIYGFKSGNFEHLVNFSKQKNTKVYELTNNYRNSKKILNFAKRFLYGMNNIYNINLNITREEDGYVLVEEYDDDLIIAIINSIGNFKDWFVLARTNAQVAHILMLLKVNNIPCDTFKKSQKTFAELKLSLQEDTVKVLTIHSAKGLECKYAIVTGNNTWNDEEKRVSYVACTRPKDILIILNNTNKKKPNRYIIPKDPSKILASIKKGIPIEHIKKYPSDSRIYSSEGLIPSNEYQIAKAIEVLTTDAYANHFDSFNDDDVIDFELMGKLPTFDD
jgi:superfamily I DNA/RNA helicase